MPHHFALHPSALAVGIVAFAVAGSIFGFFVWRALRMSRRQIDRFAHLPFADPTDPSNQT